MLRKPTDPHASICLRYVSIRAVYDGEVPSTTLLLMGTSGELQHSPVSTAKVWAIWGHGQS